MRAGIILFCFSLVYFVVAYTKRDQPIAFANYLRIAIIFLVVSIFLYLSR